MLDTREGIRRGGDNGPAVVPGNLTESLLIDAIRYSNKDTAMPPEKAGGKLPDEVIADFEKWVEMGAPDPRDGAAKLVKKYDTSEAKKWWAFQPLQEARGPGGEGRRLAARRHRPFRPRRRWRRKDSSRSPTPTAHAPPPRLFRPHRPAAIAGGNRRLRARHLRRTHSAKVVDRLLASPQFGERWGRHWLDVARFAESTGKDVNIAFPHAWRYRDYVIAAFNADKPLRPIHPRANRGRSAAGARRPGAAGRAARRHRLSRARTRRAERAESAAIRARCRR